MAVPTAVQKKIDEVGAEELTVPPGGPRPVLIIVMVSNVGWTLGSR
jgi:hypothetical protein